MITLTINRAYDAVKACLAANVPVMMWSPPGIGKTHLAYKLSDDLFGNGELEPYPWVSRPYFRTWILSQREPTDLLGLPFNDNGVTGWARPFDFPAVGTDSPDEGVIFIDELPQAPPMLQAPARQLLTEKAFGPHILKPGWRVVAAGNYQSDRAGSHALLTHTKSALTHINVVTDLEEWCGWAVQHDVMPEIVAAVRYRPELLHSFDADAQTFPCPRTWAMLSRIMAAPHAAESEHALAAGTIGEGAAAEFIGFMRYFRALPSIDEILAKPDKVKVPSEPAAKYAVASALARRATKANMPAVVTFLNRMPVEFAVFSVRDAMRRDAEVTRTKAFVEWSNKHQEVLL